MLGDCNLLQLVNNGSDARVLHQSAHNCQLAARVNTTCTAAACKLSAELDIKHTHQATQQVNTANTCPAVRQYKGSCRHYTTHSFSVGPPWRDIRAASAARRYLCLHMQHECIAVKLCTATSADGLICCRPACKVHEGGRGRWWK